MSETMEQPAVWFPAIRTRSGTDVFTEQLIGGLRSRGLRAEVEWLPHRAEFAPASVFVPETPDWANVVHVNSWLPERFLPDQLPVVATVHLFVHDPVLASHKSLAQRLYHKAHIFPMECEVLERASAITAVSSYTADILRKRLGIERIEVIPNGIKLDGEFHPRSRTGPGSPFRLLFIGNWTKRKGSDLLWPIMEMLGDSFHLDILAARGRPKGVRALPPNVTWLPPARGAASVAHHCRESDALLLPSRGEGLPLAVLEAQACGLPVIASDCSAFPECVENGRNGTLCPVDDIEAFAAAAREMAASEQRWLAMRNHSLRWVRERFDFEKMLDTYIALYKRTLRNCV